MANHVAELARRRERARLGGGQARIDQSAAKGKLTARERLELLLDEGSFEEIDMFVDTAALIWAWRNKMPGDGVVTGWGTIERPAGLMSSARISPFLAARFLQRTREDLQVMDMAMKVGAPVIGLNDSWRRPHSGGCRSLGGYADVFQRNVMASGVCRRSRDHGAMRGRCGLFARDDRLHLHGPRQFLYVRNGPDVVKTVTNEVYARRTGRRVTHTTKSCVADVAFENDCRGTAERARAFLISCR